jgi:diadenosine tetraphosphate (Ap4A) HIT family hydrolase
MSVSINGDHKMNIINECRFCEILSENYTYGEVDVPFAVNDEFMALASIGALVEGWSLVIPKTHKMSMKSFYSNPGLIDFVNNISSKLTTRYGRIIAFEHGANREGSITACGTDHAHLHLVPFEESLLPELEQTSLSWVKCRPSEISSFARQNEYLFYCDIINHLSWEEQTGYLHVLQFPISQFFRKLIAERKGKTEVSNYKYFPHLDIASKTRNELIASFA